MKYSLPLLKEEIEESKIKNAVVLQLDCDFQGEIKDKILEQLLTVRPHQKKIGTPKSVGRVALILRWFCFFLPWFVFLACVLLWDLHYFRQSSVKPSVESLITERDHVRCSMFDKSGEEMRRLELFKKSSIQGIRSFVKLVDLVRSKIEKEGENIILESTELVRTFYENCSSDSLGLQFSVEKDTVVNSITKMMDEAEKTLNEKVKVSDPQVWRVLQAEIQLEDQIERLGASYEKTSIDAWDDLKNYGKPDIQAAASKFEETIGRARQEFETTVTVAREDFERRAKLVQEEFLKSKFDSILVEYDAAVDRAVAEFSRLTSIAFKNFSIRCDQENGAAEEKKKLEA